MKYDQTLLFQELWTLVRERGMVEISNCWYSFILSFFFHLIVPILNLLKYLNLCATDQYAMDYFPVFKYFPFKIWNIFITLQSKICIQYIVVNIAWQQFQGYWRGDCIGVKDSCNLCVCFVLCTPTDNSVFFMTNLPFPTPPPFSKVLLHLLHVVKPNSSCLTCQKFFFLGD